MPPKPTLGQQAAAELKAARAKAGSLPWDEVANIIDRFAALQPRRAPRKKSTALMTDEEWIAHLEAEPSLAGVDIRREIGKAQFWAR